jgi:hypothetical protein
VQIISTWAEVGVENMIIIIKAITLSMNPTDNNTEKNPIPKAGISTSLPRMTSPN